MLRRSQVVAHLVKETLSIHNDVPSVATSAKTSSIVSSALIRNRKAEAIDILNPVRRTLKADSVVPGLAARVGWSSSVVRGPSALPVHQIVALIASQAHTSDVESPASIFNWRAESQSVEHPSWRTLLTNSVLPNAAPRISRSSLVRFRVDTCSIDEVIALVARQTESIDGVPSPALATHFLTNTSRVEESPFSTGLTSSFSPLGTVGIGIDVSRSRSRRVHHASSFVQDVAVVAVSANSCGAVPISAVVTDGQAIIVVSGVVFG